jgi:PAS domain S-box-containing protein
MENINQAGNQNSVWYSLDKNGKVLDVSENIDVLLGYKKEEAIGQNFRLFINPEDEEAVFLHFQKALGGVFEPCEFRITTKSGEQVRLRSLCALPKAEEKDARIDGTLTKV